MSADNTNQGLVDKEGDLVSTYDRANDPTNDVSAVSDQSYVRLGKDLPSFDSSIHWGGAEGVGEDYYKG